MVEEQVQNKNLFFSYFPRFSRRALRRKKFYANWLAEH